MSKKTDYITKPFGKIKNAYQKSGRIAKAGAKRLKQPGIKSAAKGCGVDAGLGALEQVLVEGSRKDRDLKRGARNVAAAGATSGGRGAAIKGTAYGLEKAAVKVGIKQTGKQATKQAARQGFKQTAKASARGNALVGAATTLVDQGTDTYRLARGKIDKKEYRSRSCENVSGGIGSVGGAAGGAALGTMIFPGPGTVVGGIIGGLAGDLGCRSGAKKIFR